MTEKPRRLALRLIEAVETMPMSAARWCLFLAAIIVIRHFLEAISGQQTIFHVVAYLVHYPLGYIAPLIALVLVLSLMARERVGRVSKLMLLAWLLTLLPPLLDIFMRSTGKQQIIGYLLVEPSQLGTAFVNLLNPLYGEFPGATGGIRLEALVGCLAGAAYVWLKTKSLGRALLTLPVVYTTMFFFFTLPVELVRFTGLFSPGIRSVVDLFFQNTGIARGLDATAPVIRANLSLSLIDVFVLVPLLAAWYRLHDPQAFRRLLGSAGTAWLIYCPLLTFAGIVLGAKLLVGADGLVRVTHPFDVYALLGLLLSSLLAGLGATMLSGLSAGPTAPSAGSPTPGRAAPDTDLRAALAVTAGLSALAAYVVSFAALTYVLGFLAISCLYYLRPIRLARFAGISSISVGLASLFAFSLGFSAYAGATAPITTPKSVVTVIIVSVALALLARDSWRVPQDGPAPPQQWGLSRILGQKRARAVGFVACVVAALLPGVVLRSPSLTVAGVFAGALALLSIILGDTRTIPLRLLGVLAAFMVAANGLHVADLPVLRGDVAEASRSVSAGLGAPPASAGANPRLTELQTRASQLFDAADYEAAAGLFEEIIAEDPTWPGAYLNLGVALMRSGRADEAVKALEGAVTRAPEDAETHRYLGQALTLRGDLEAAESSLSKALELDPRDSAAATALASVRKARGDSEGEHQALRLAASLDPTNSEALARLGDSHVERQEYTQALAAYQAALKAPKPVDGVHSRMAQVYYMMRDLESAEREIREEIRLNPRSPLPHVNLSNILAARSSTSEARAELDTALRLATDPALRARIEQQRRALGG